MKVKIIDLIWAVISMFIVGYSYLHGILLFGLVAIYGIMLVIFLCHIVSMKKSIRKNITVYGKVTGYYEKNKGRHVYPIVKYTTTEGREVTASLSAMIPKTPCSSTLQDEKTSLQGIIRDFSISAVSLQLYCSYSLFPKSYNRSLGGHVNRR